MNWAPALRISTLEINLYNFFFKLFSFESDFIYDSWLKIDNWHINSKTGRHSITEKPFDESFFNSWQL